MVANVWLSRDRMCKSWSSKQPQAKAPQMSIKRMLIFLTIEFVIWMCLLPKPRYPIELCIQSIVNMMSLLRIEAYVQSIVHKTYVFFSYNKIYDLYLIWHPRLGMNRMIYPLYREHGMTPKE